MSETTLDLKVGADLKILLPGQHSYICIDCKSDPSQVTVKYGDTNGQIDTITYPIFSSP